MRVHRVRFSNTPTVAFLQARPQGVLSESHAQVEKVLRARRRRNASQKKQKRQCEDVQWEHEPECLGPKRNRVLGVGKCASERVNCRCDERLLEAVRIGVVTPGMAASEERGGCAMMIRAAGARHARRRRWRLARLGLGSVWGAGRRYSSLLCLLRQGAAFYAAAPGPLNPCDFSLAKRCA